MHIIIGLLGAIVTILALLSRLADAGIDLGGLNPFLWHRRRKWRKKYEGNPVFKIDDPMDATAILMVACAKADGDMTKEDKSLLLNLFENDFKLSKKDAAGLLISSTHLLGDGNEVRNSVNGFLARSKSDFAETQASSAIDLISQVAGDPDTMHPNTKEFLQKVEQELKPVQTDEKTW